MKYFNQFPGIDYDLKGDGNTKEVTDIFRRVKARSKIINNVTAFDKYDVSEGEKPEDIAYKVYGDTDYFWVVTLVNNIINRYYDWPLDEYVFQQYVKDKYAQPDDVHHYEKTQLSGRQTGEGPSDYSHKVECNETEAGAEAVAVEKIIAIFKYNSAPGFKDGTMGSVFTTPNYWKISYMFNSAENTSLNRIGACYCTDVEVDYSPDGQWTTFGDGKPVHTRLVVNMLEDRIITKQDIEQGA